jgi:Na+/proline symporter
MSPLDWTVLALAITAVVVYGVWKGRANRDMEGYLVSDRSMPWYGVALSVMATQASAITFLSTPGQGFADGMRFVQIYLGLPIAMVILSITAVPLYHRLKVYTAYEFLESRFDLKTRCLAAFLFLTQRGLAAGLTIFAPSLILSTILGWSLFWTNLALGSFVVIYTAAGGSRAVDWTHVHQMIVIFCGLFVAFGMVIWLLPDGVSFVDATRVAGTAGRLNAIDYSFDIKSRYNFWSGLLGGLFLSLSYFGTDQSQVQRYLSGRSVTESRLGLLFNGMLKIPMQFVILFTGVMVFVFYLFTPPPIFFNAPTLARVARSEHAPELQALEARYGAAFARQRDAATAYVAALDAAATQRDAAKAALRAAADDVRAVRAEAKGLVARAAPGAETKDTDYVFLSFVLGYVPSGLVGLLIAVILCAAMSSISAELTALGSTTTIDFYRRIRGTGDSGARDLVMSKLFTVFWGLVAVGFAAFASLLDNLIEAVNILGSIFYGTVLGLFVVAFFVAWVTATPVLIAALVAQVLVIVLFFTTGLGFLWYNVIGCATVVGVAIVLEAVRGHLPPGAATDFKTR